MRRSGFPVIFGLALTATAVQAETIQLYSFENGSEGWSSPSGFDVFFDGVTGVTDGMNSARLPAITGGFNNFTLQSETITAGPAFNAMKQLGERFEAGDTDLRIDFDITPDISNVTLGFVQVGMFFNSDAGAPSGGVKQYTTGQFLRIPTSTGVLEVQNTPAPRAGFDDGVTIQDLGNGTFHVSAPLDQTPSNNQWRLSVNPASSFFEIGFMTNGNFGTGGTLGLAFDNITISGANLVNVPEPNALALAALAFGALGAARRRAA